MTATVLCPGKSLRDFVATGNERLIIGVNRACLAHICHWAAITDYTFIKDVRYTPKYPVKLFTDANTAQKVHIFMPNVTEVLTKEAVAGQWPMDGWETKTATSALVLAAYLGATRVEVFGCDMAGIADWDGHEYDRKGEEASKTRDGKRWRDERGLWDRVCKALAGRSVEVIRHDSNRLVPRQIVGDPIAAI